MVRVGQVWMKSNKFLPGYWKSECNNLVVIIVVNASYIYYRYTTDGDGEHHSTWTMSTDFIMKFELVLDV